MLMLVFVADSLFSIPGVFLHRDPGKRSVSSLAVSGLVSFSRLSSAVVLL